MASGARLRLLSYNIHGLRDDRAALTAVLRDAEPDVAILQEAPRRLRWRTRTAQLAQRTGLVYAAGGAPSLGNVILTSMRVRVTGSSCLTFPLTPGRHLRGAVHACCAVAGGGFLVAGSHLSTDPAERPGQARLLHRALAEAAAGSGLPVLLGADLNEPPGAEVWRLLGDGLVDAGLVDAGSADPARETRPAASTLLAANTFPAADPTQRLDGVLVDPRVVVTRYQVVDSPEARLASDHLPVLVEVELPAS
ncbi:MAG: endonuclease/exonuclease/phosphatase family protein [Micromonosporaceae bacterium]|nr:endonuclease/exonuclease/phosphatase family protein [Micromonosporaceae bacterium]